VAESVDSVVADTVKPFLEKRKHVTLKVALYILVNLGMGGGWPTDKAVSPSYMEVDYVRVYARRR
jgi:hypothetical protein